MKGHTSVVMQNIVQIFRGIFCCLLMIWQDKDWSVDFEFVHVMGVLLQRMGSDGVYIEKKKVSSRPLIYAAGCLHSRWMA